jgi:cell fate regulator YaaT (PSP1 superfamily)
MIDVIGVRLGNGSRLHYFDPQDVFYSKDTDVIVQTPNGLEVGRVSAPNKKTAPTDVALPLKPVVRKVTAEDVEIFQKNQTLAQKATRVFIKAAEEEGLDMRLVDAHYNFEATHVIFTYTADARVDFRNLVKKLAKLLRVRIEMHQISMREKARIVGGIGPCGYDLCCNTFLQDLHGSTIKMVKNQRLTLVPERISGLCGKLLCCLRYENEMYTELAQVLPDVNEVITTPDGTGKVIYVNIITQKVDVLIQNRSGSTSKKQYHYSELKDSLKDETLRAAGRVHEQMADKQPV